TDVTKNAAYGVEIESLVLTDVTKNAAYGVEIESLVLEINAPAA
ncbi:hypothetical protein, partial [Escherichia coli]